MNLYITKSIILSLTGTEKPIDFVDGKLITQPNTSQDYIIFDEHRDAPIGFGVKVTIKGSKSYIVQTRVGKRVIKIKVGNVRDMALDGARQKAKELLLVANKTKQNPNVLERQQDLNELTIYDAFNTYDEYLKSKTPPAKPNTLISIGKAKNKFKSWENVKINQITSNMILTRFNEIAETARTTAEQSFRYLSRAVDIIINREKHSALAQKREPAFTHNPFTILIEENKYRGKTQLEQSYQEKGIRNPIGLDQVADFITAAWNKRKNNETGVDYMLCTLLWGVRKSESFQLKWLDRLTPAEGLKTSHIDIQNRLVFFKNTKNGTDHLLPIGDAVFELLKQRRYAVDEKYGNNKLKRVFVFPAESIYSKTGHYCSVDDILKSTATSAGIKGKFSAHDLRRSFSGIAENLQVPYSYVKRFINHKDSRDITLLYTAGSNNEEIWNRMREYMQRIEDAMLIKSPDVLTRV